MTQQPPFLPHQGNYQHISPTPQPQPTDKRKLENFVLNVVLYVAALLLVGAAALLVTEVFPASIRVGLLALGTAIFYSAGLLTYKWVPKLRLASYSFTATGIALLPLLGWACYALLWHRGAAVWALTSLLGTLLVVLAASLMRERIMAYLLISFMISDVLSASKLLQLSIVWYFVALLVLATALKLLVRFWDQKIPSKMLSGFLDASRIFVPVTALAAIYLYSHFARWELALLFGLATVYALVLMQKPIEISLYIQARVYSLFAIFFLALNFTNDYWVFLPTLLFSCLLLISAILISRLPESALPWNPLADAQISWWLALASGTLAVFQTGLTNMLYSAGKSQEVQFNLQWLFLRAHNDGAVLFPAWVLPVLLLVSTIFFMGKVRVENFYLMLGLASLVFCAILTYQGACLILLCAGILLLTTRPSSSSSFLTKMLGSYLILISLFIMAAQTLQMKFLDFLLVLSLFISVLALLQAILASRAAKDPSAEKLAQPVLWAAIVLVNVFLACYDFLLILPAPSLSSLSFERFSTQLLVGAVPCAALLMGTILILMRKQEEARLHSLQIAFYLEQVLALLPLFFFIFPHAAFIFIGLLLVLNAVTLFALPKIPKIGASISIRLLLVLGFLRAFTAYRDELKTLSLVLLILLSVLALVSLLIYRLEKSSIEVGIGLTASCLSFLAASLVLFSFDGSLLSSLSFLAPALLSALWLYLSYGQASQVIFSLLTVLAVFVISIEMGQELFTHSTKVSSAFGLWLSFFWVIVCKVLAAKMRQTEKTKEEIDDPLKNWGHSYNASLILPALIVFSGLYLCFTWSTDIFSSTLLLLLAFGLYGCQSRPQNRILVWVSGALLTLLRLLMELEEFSGFFALMESLLIIFLAISTIRLAQKVKAGENIALLWLAFTSHFLATLLVLPGYFYQPSIEKRIILLVFSVFLLLVVALHRSQALIIASAGLITLQVLWMSGGLNPLTLFALGLILMALVIWRLLVRKEEAAEKAIPAVPPVPLAPSASYPGQTVTVQGSSTAQTVANQVGLAQPQEQDPWLPPQGSEIKPFGK